MNSLVIVLEFSVGNRAERQCKAAGKCSRKQSPNRQHVVYSSNIHVGDSASGNRGVYNRESAAKPTWLL